MVKAYQIYRIRILEHVRSVNIIPSYVGGTYGSALGCIVGNRSLGIEYGLIESSEGV
jgi:hypothetical protein